MNYSFKKLSSTEKKYQKKILFFYQKVLQFCFDVIFFIIFFLIIRRELLKDPAFYRVQESQRGGIRHKNEAYFTRLIH